MTGIDTLLQGVSVAQEVAGKVIAHIDNVPALDFWHYFLAFTGALLYILFELDQLNKQNKLIFGGWIVDNWIAVLSTVISIIVMFLLKEDLKQIMGFDMTNRLGCFLGGFTAHTLTTKVSRFINSQYKRKP